jgi:hypothetical protein
LDACVGNAATGTAAGASVRPFDAFVKMPAQINDRGDDNENYDNGLHV